MRCAWPQAASRCRRLPCRAALRLVSRGRRQPRLREVGGAALRGRAGWWRRRAWQATPGRAHATKVSWSGLAQVAITGDNCLPDGQAK